MKGFKNEKFDDTFGNEKDFRAVEELTRKAFWNVYKPGADEHYYVHMMRNHPDFIPALAETVELTKTGNVFDREALYWSGYLYRFWHFTIGEDSKEIYKQAPPLPKL